MSPHLATSAPSAAQPARLPSALWWGVLALVLAELILLGPIPAFCTVGVLALLLAGPFDRLAAFLIVAASASFIDYTRGHLTAQLALLSIAMLYLLASWVLAHRSGLVRLPRTPLTGVLAAYLALSMVNFLRGVALGHSLRYAGLEILVVMALGSAFLLSDREMSPGAMRILKGFLFLLGLGHLALGLYVFATVHVRTGHLSFTPVPGLIAALFFNYALRARTLRGRVIWAFALMPMLVHQFVSFTRGYWLGLLLCLGWSLLVFTGRGAGVRERWSRVLQVILVVMGLTILGAAVFGSAFGLQDLGKEAGNRLSSSVDTEVTYETGSNFVRLVEYARVLTHITESPWIGHGLGFSFVVREPFRLQLLEQWATHNNYLLVWLKQGLIGLLLFLGTLLAAVRMGYSCRRSPDPDVAAWGVGTAAASVYLLFYCLVHFPLGEVNTTFTFAMMLGITMHMARKGEITIRWLPVPAPARIVEPGDPAP